MPRNFRRFHEAASDGGRSARCGGCGRGSSRDFDPVSRCDEIEAGTRHRESVDGAQGVGVEAQLRGVGLGFFGDMGRIHAIGLEVDDPDFVVANEGEIDDPLDDLVIVVAEPGDRLMTSEAGGVGRGESEGEGQLALDAVGFVPEGLSEWGEPESSKAWEVDAFECFRGEPTGSVQAMGLFAEGFEGSGLGEVDVFVEGMVCETAIDGGLATSVGGLGIAGVSVGRGRWRRVVGFFVREPETSQGSDGGFGGFDRCRGPGVLP